MLILLDFIQDNLSAVARKLGLYLYIGIGEIRYEIYIGIRLIFRKKTVLCFNY